MGVGSCQFIAIIHQLQSVGLYKSAMNLRQMAVQHITEQQEYYKDFVEVPVKNYLSKMKQDSTFGDNLALIALARELNIQFLVLNSTGRNYDRIVSNSGQYSSDLNTIFLGFYPEIHYVSVRITDKDLENNIIRRSLACSEKEDQSRSQSASNCSTNVSVSDVELECMVPGAPLSDSMENQSINSPTRSQLQQETCNVQTECPGDQASENTSETTEERPDPVLPDLVLEKIIRASIDHCPTMRYTLQRVCRFFERVVCSYGYPSIYIRPSLAYDITPVVSVARLSRVYGSHSGLLLNLRRILRDTGSRWFRAWLTLHDIGLGWYEIRDIHWNT